jgi:hypothetical protein
MRECIGLSTYLYRFDLNSSAKMKRYMARLANLGQITEVFLNNEYGFLLRLTRRFV